jgi:predicted pyridoxine 5'-phosphate oxidase superfamily flavin-nucleotide-binding protein
MGQAYHDGQRTLQDRFDTRRLADRLDEATSDHISDAHRAFIESRDMFFLATADADGVPQCSYKGGEPGFVRVVDERTIAFPVYDGNGMFLSMGNVSVNPNVGILFVDFERGTRLRFNGVAAADEADPLLGSYPGAQLVVRVRGDAVFANCRRYVHRYELVERSPFVPSASIEPPVPDWKLDPWFEGTLPADDPARDPANPSAPAIPLF